MIQELFSWLDAQRITYIPVDTEVVDIPGFGRLFTADLSGVESIFRGDGDKLVFNLMESPDVLMEEGIFHVAFPFGRNWYYYDLREEFRFNLLKYIGRPKPPVHDVPFVNLGIHTSYELLNACCSPGRFVPQGEMARAYGCRHLRPQYNGRHAEPSEGVRQYRAETYIRLLADNDARRRTCRAEDLCLG